MLVFGTQPMVDWLRRNQGVTDGRASEMPTAIALANVATRLGVPEAGIAVSAAMLVGLAWWAWRRRPGRSRVSAAALCAALLASPASIWVGYVLALVPLGYAYAQTRPSVRVAAVFFSVPVIAPITLALSRVPVPLSGVLSVGTLCTAVIAGLIVALVAHADAPGESVGARDLSMPRVSPGEQAAPAAEAG
jgi:hypothetical protein